MWNWVKKHWKTLFGNVGTAIVTLIAGVVIGQYFPTRGNTTSISNKNTNSGQQQPIYNQGDVNQQTNIQSQGIPPQELVKGLKDLGETEYKLKKTELEIQGLQKELGLYRKEDKDIRESLISAENNEKYELTAVVWYEYIEGHITKDNALKLSDMINKAYWKDLKSFIDNKNIKIDEHNQSLVFAGIFEPKAEGGLRRYTRLGTSKIRYKLTADGNKLYEIANKYLSTRTIIEK